MERALIRKGMKVTLRGVDGVFKVDKVNPKTINITDVENEFRGYRASASLLTPVEGEVTDSSAEYRRLLAEAEEEKRYGKGVVVRIRSNNRLASKLEGLQVITDNRMGNLQLFPLGGSPDGRYYRGVHYSNVEIVSVDELLGVEVV